MKSSAHSRFVGAPLLVLLMQLLRVLPMAAAAAAAVDPQTRSAHWVIRTSKLETTLDFLKQVMGMRVLRHEENDEPCPITCNGDSPTAWSKTMVGYETEDKAWCLEVTYNYGVGSYASGSGLASIAVAVPDAVESARLAQSLGYHVRHVGGVGGVMVLGPDGYRFSLVDKKTSAMSLPALAKREEPFLSVKLHVADLAVTQAFYSDVLGMRNLFDTADAAATASPATNDVLGGLRSDGDLVMGYSRDQVALIFRRNAGGAPPRIEQYEGRHAISMPAEEVKKAYATSVKKYPGSVVHEIMELEEQLGTLFIAIIKDPDGFELCLVSSETFDKAVAAAGDFKEPDWAAREVLVEKRAKEAKQKALQAAAAGTDKGARGSGGRIKASEYVIPPLPLGQEGEEGSFAHLMRRLVAVTAHMGSLEANFLVTGILLGLTVFGTYLYNLNSLFAKEEDRIRWNK